MSLEKTQGMPGEHVPKRFLGSTEKKINLSSSVEKKRGSLILFVFLIRN